MGRKDIIVMEILGDGVLKVETDTISGSNHLSAERLVKGLSEALGSQPVTTRKRGKVGHVHNHTHETEG